MNCTEIEWCVQRVYYTSYPKRHECVIFVVVAIQQKCDMKLSMCPRACKFNSYTQSVDWCVSVFSRMRMYICLTFPE